MSEDAFNYVWRLIKAEEEDEAEKWSNEYDEAYSRGDQETMDRMNADNEKMERYWSDYETHADEVDPLPPDQRLIDMANAAYGWGSEVAYMDHYDTIFEEHTSDLEGDDYWDAVHSAESLHDKIWRAGMAALGLKTTQDMKKNQFHSTEEEWRTYYEPDYKPNGDLE